MMSQTNNAGAQSFDRTMAAMIDHTILKADATPADVDRVCSEALEYGFASVCVNSSFVAQCRDRLKNSPVRVCTVVGFPLGAMSTEGKVAETRQALLDGATEIDMVIHVGKLKSANDDAVRNDIAAVVHEAHGRKAVVKVIIETCLLTNDEKARACKLAKDAGADFVKTSTGFSTGGATADDIRLMRSIVGPTMGVKASGGIRTKEQAAAMAAAGATRIGASASVQIVRSVAPATSASY